MNQANPKILERPCIKCNSLDISRHYYEKGTNVQALHYGKTLNNLCVSDCGTWTNTVIRSHIHNHCQSCQYSWAVLAVKKR